MPAEWAKLNGYVDGELDTASAAEVAAAIASNSKLAQQAAALHHMKAVLSELQPAERAPQLPRELLQRTSFSRFSWAAAAAIVMMIVGGVIALTKLTTSDGIAPFDQAFQAQEQWLSNGIIAGASARSLDATIVADLADAGLNAVYTSAGVTANHAPHLIGFEGPHGCKLGLWIAQPTDSLPMGLIKPLPPKADIRAAAWRSADASYVLLAKGMDAERFDRYVRAISTLILRDPTAREHDRIAVRSASQTGTPCHA